MLQCIYFKIALGLLTVILNTVHGHNLVASFTRVECPLISSQYVKEYGCALVPRHDGVLQFNAYLIPRQDLHNITLSVNVCASYYGKNGTYLATTLNICDALGQMHSNILLRYAFDDIRRLSNLPLECPLKKNIHYALQNLTVASHLIPAYVPEMQWMSYNNVSAYDKLGVIFNVFGNIKKIKKSKYDARN